MKNNKTLVDLEVENNINGANKFTKLNELVECNYTQIQEVQNYCNYTSSIDSISINVVEEISDCCTVIGSELDDIIVGSFLSQKIYGMGGNDILKGGGGNDTLVGGNGRDVFIISLANVYVFVEDFNVQIQEKINLLAFNITNFNDINKEQYANNTKIILNDDIVIELNNVLHSDLVLENFIIREITRIEEIKNSLLAWFMGIPASLLSLVIGAVIRPKAEEFVKKLFKRYPDLQEVHEIKNDLDVLVNAISANYLIDEQRKKNLENIHRAIKVTDTINGYTYKNFGLWINKVGVSFEDLYKYFNLNIALANYYMFFFKDGSKARKLLFKGIEAANKATDTLDLNGLFNDNKEEIYNHLNNYYEKKFIAYYARMLYYIGRTYVYDYGENTWSCTGYIGKYLLSLRLGNGIKYLKASEFLSKKMEMFEWFSSEVYSIVLEIEALERNHLITSSKKAISIESIIHKLNNLDSLSNKDTELKLEYDGYENVKKTIISKNLRCKADVWCQKLRCYKYIVKLGAKNLFPIVKEGLKKFFISDFLEFQSSEQFNNKQLEHPIDSQKQSSVLNRLAYLLIEVSTTQENIVSFMEEDDVIDWLKRQIESSIRFDIDHAKKSYFTTEKEVKKLRVECFKEIASVCKQLNDANVYELVLSLNENDDLSLDSFIVEFREALLTNSMMDDSSIFSSLRNKLNLLKDKEQRHQEPQQQEISEYHKDEIQDKINAAYEKIVTKFNEYLESYANGNGAHKELCHLIIDLSRIKFFDPNNKIEAENAKKNLEDLENFKNNQKLILNIQKLNLEEIIEQSIEEKQNNIIAEINKCDELCIGQSIQLEFQSYSEKEDIGLHTSPSSESPEFTAYRITTDIETPRIPPELEQEWRSTTNYLASSSSGKGNIVSGFTSDMEEFCNTYYGAGIDNILQLRLKDSGLNNIRALKAFILDRSSLKYFVGLINKQLKYECEEIIAPCNIENKHWIGIALKKTDNELTLTYIDSENKGIDKKLAANLKSSFSAIDNIQIKELPVEQQKHSNCGPEMIENLILFLTGERVSQENAVFYHSRLVEADLLHSSNTIPQIPQIKQHTEVETTSSSLSDKRNEVIFKTGVWHKISNVLEFITQPLNVARIESSNLGLTESADIAMFHYKFNDLSMKFGYSFNVYCSNKAGWYFKQYLYSQEIRQFKNLLQQYHVDQSFEEVLTPKGFRLLAVKLHPDKGGDAKNFAFAKSFQTQMNSPIDMRSLLDDKIQKLQPILYSSAIGFKILDTAIDSFRVYKETTLTNIGTLVLSSANLYGMCYGFSKLSIGINLLAVSYNAYAQENLNESLGQGLSSLLFMSLPYMLYYTGIPYVGFAYSVFATMYTGYIALSKGYSLYTEFYLTDNTESPPNGINLSTEKNTISEEAEDSLLFPNQTDCINITRTEDYKLAETLIINDTSAEYRNVNVVKYIYTNITTEESCEVTHIKSKLILNKEVDKIENTTNYCYNEQHQILDHIILNGDYFQVTDNHLHN